jgi:hypothetical protein
MVIRSLRYLGVGFAFLTAGFQALALTAGALTHSGFGLFLFTVPLALASLFLSWKGGSRIGKRVSKVTVGVSGVFFGLPFAALVVGWVAFGLWYVSDAFWS